ncbi:MAG: DMT family transporter [Burkholderiales bacterium]|nr:DMT family transporter [Burkholderiales bacterium]
MIVAVGLLTVNDGLAKYLVQTHPVGQVLCLRHVTVLLAILPYAAVMTGWRALRPHHWPGQILRGLLFVAGAASLTLAVKLLPLATVISLTMSAPIFVAALSVPFLGERVNAARWLAILGGFVGVLMIVRPGGQAFEWALLLALAAALANGLRDLVTRRLARTETSIAVLFWSNVVVALGTLATFSAAWQPLDTIATLWFLLAGTLNAVAHFVAIEAMRWGEAALIAPLRYTALVWASAFGWLVWGDVPEPWVVLGALVIAASGIAMIVMESRAWRRV